MSTSGSFEDLRLRFLSALVMSAVGLISLYLGGWAFLGLLSVCAGLMVWEALRMADPKASQLVVYGLPLLAAACIGYVGVGGKLTHVGLPLVPIVGFFLIKSNKAIFASYSLAILLAVAALLSFRATHGLTFTLWLVLVVIAADIGGYLAGRLFGGPKIYPRISPKKTWSGTMGGLVLAGLVGLYFGIGPAFVFLSVLTALASQFGDVAESAIKRQMGVKDSSHLIPGHGGLLDRFDGLIGAALFVLIYFMIFSLPHFGGV